MQGDSSKKADSLKQDHSSSDGEKPPPEKSSSSRTRLHKKSSSSPSSSSKIRPTPPPEKLNEDELEQCIKITNDLYDSIYSFSLRSPPDPSDENTADFLKSTEKPMDLEAILENLKNNVYKTMNEWKDDMNLVFDNAINYYNTKSIQYSNALKMKRKFEKYEKLFNKSEEELWIIKTERLCKKFMEAENVQ